MLANLRLQELLPSRRVLVLFVLTVVAYFAAINRGQAFLWVIPALLSAVLIAGVAWPRWLVTRLSVTRSGPTRAAEGESIRFCVAVENRGWSPRFMVEVIDHLPFVKVDESTSHYGQSILGLLAYLPAKGARKFDVAVMCEKRGFYRLGPVGLRSSFPLGLREASVLRQEGLRTLTIYPEIFPILSLPLRGAPSQIHRGGYVLPEGAGAAEFAGLREYRRGDNPRHIHWPTTARLNELMVREYEPLASPCICLLLDQSGGSNAGQGKESSFEYSVKIAASIARFSCAGNMRTRGVGSGLRSLQVSAGFGGGHFQSMLDQLAIVDCEGTTSYASVIEAAAASFVRGETAVVFLSVLNAEWSAVIRALSSLIARQVHLLAVVLDAESFVSSTRVPQGEYVDARSVNGTLQELGAYCINVSRGDNLLKLFNP